jgi:hypothetical protein
MPVTVIERREQLLSLCTNIVEAIAEIANHMRVFWHRRLWEKLVAQLDREEDGLDDLPREAIRVLAETMTKPRNLPDKTSS